MKKGIDISYAQGAVDFQRLRGHTDFVIIRAGYGRLDTQRDEYFERNYAYCKKLKIPCGAYWFSYAQSAQEARQEAQACLAVIKGKRFEYPIYYDVEGSALQGGRDTVSEMCRTFCDELEKRYALWVAEYGGRLNYSGYVGMWQYSSGGRLPGITGSVDTDYCYEDYPDIIKKAHLNGYKKRRRKKAVKK